MGRMWSGEDAEISATQHVPGSPRMMRMAGTAPRITSAHHWMECSSVSWAPAGTSPRPTVVAGILVMQSHLSTVTTRETVLNWMEWSAVTMDTVQSKMLHCIVISLSCLTQVEQLAV